MAASAAMIVLGVAPCAFAQDAPPPASDGSVSGNLMLLNKMDGLRGQMQQMQGEIEELQHSLKELQRTSKDQYLDLDSRVGKLEHAAQAQPAASASAGSAAAAEAALNGGATPPVSSAPATSAVAPSTHSTPASKAAYDAAFKALRDGNYVASASGFRAFTQKFPSDPLVSNAYYWLGESYYVTQNFKIALASFQTLLQKYPHSGKAPDAQLKVGYCQAELKDYADARRTLEAVVKAYPGTPVERLAKKRLEAIPSHSAPAKH